MVSFLLAAAKEAAKEATKEASKTATKEAAKTVVKETVKETVKKTANQAAAKVPESFVSTELRNLLEPVFNFYQIPMDQMDTVLIVVPLFLVVAIVLYMQLFQRPWKKQAATDDMRTKGASKNSVPKVKVSSGVERSPSPEPRRAKKSPQGKNNNRREKSAEPRRMRSDAKDAKKSTSTPKKSTSTAKKTPTKKTPTKSAAKSRSEKGSKAKNTPRAASPEPRARKKAKTPSRRRSMVPEIPESLILDDEITFSNSGRPQRKRKAPQKFEADSVISTGSPKVSSRSNRANRRKSMY